MQGHFPGLKLSRQCLNLVDEGPLLGCLLHLHATAAAELVKDMGPLTARHHTLLPLCKPYWRGTLPSLATDVMSGCLSLAEIFLLHGFSFLPFHWELHGYFSSRVTFAYPIHAASCTITQLHCIESTDYLFAGFQRHRFPSLT
jgi:hypothetical protein